MYHIVIHCKPKIDNIEFHGKVVGSYASILIDYKDYDGAVVLSKYYVENNGWEILKLEDEYYTFDSKDDLPEDYQEYFDEIVEYGYSMIFNNYAGEEDEK